MQYVTLEDLKNYTDLTADETMIIQMVELAEAQIEIITNNRLTPELFDRLNTRYKKYVKLAIISQAEQLIDNKMKYGAVSSSAIPNSFSIGSYSQSNHKYGQAQNEKAIDDIEIIREAYFYLRTTGLLFGGVAYL